MDEKVQVQQSNKKTRVKNKHRGNTIISYFAMVTRKQINDQMQQLKIKF